MVRTSRGFLQLETLELRHSKELEELIVEEGAMPYLNALVIESCLIMKKISPRLLQLTNLQYLTLLHLSHESIDEATQIKKKRFDLSAHYTGGDIRCHEGLGEL